MLLIFAVSCSACCQDVPDPIAIQQGDDLSQPPLEINFKQSCGVPEGRQQAYDPKTGVFHIHFKPQRFAVSAFGVTKVAERFAKPVVFRLTGVPLAYGCVGLPLVLTVGEKRYVMIDVGPSSFHAYERFDRTLFRVERKEDVVTVAFTEKGQALLRPGAQISFKVDTGW